MTQMKINFDGELYDYIANENGSKTIKNDKNKNGFKITINVSGDPEEHKAGIDAVKDFFAKSSIL